MKISRANKVMVAIMLIIMAVLFVNGESYRLMIAYPVIFASAFKVVQWFLEFMDE